MKREDPTSVRAAATTMVELVGVSKRYGELDALSDIDLVIPRGEFVTLLGPSGSGKTTLLNLIAGTLVPSTGRILIAGKDATDVPPSRRGLGMVFQNYALMPHMTVFENIAFPLRVRRLPASEISRKVAEVLELIRLPDVAKRKPVELSGGQQQRVSLARCIVYNPSLILLDEPLGALDRKLREQMQLEIKRIHGELGITMLNVTHDQDEALTMSDRIVLMNRGRIEQDSRPSELYFQPATVFAADFLGDANLLAGEVVESGESVRLKTGFGSIAASRPSFQVCTGDAVTVMVRPECIHVVERDSDEVANHVAGVIEDSIVVGGVVKHHVQLEDATQLVVQEPNRLQRQALRKGETVLLAWSESDCRVLPASGVQRGRGSNVGLPA